MCSQDKNFIVYIHVYDKIYVRFVFTDKSSESQYNDWFSMKRDLLYSLLLSSKEILVKLWFR